MVEKSFHVVQTFQQKRDVYGFALRPQQVQRYKEYLTIYKEEDAERVEKWRNFFHRRDELSKLHSSEQGNATSLEEYGEANDSRIKSHELDSLSEYGDPERGRQPLNERETLESSSHLHNLQSRQENEPEKFTAKQEEHGYKHEKEGEMRTKACKIQEWARFGSSLGSIETMMYSRVKKAKKHMEDEFSKEESHESVSSEPLFSCYDEVEVLVRLGVPKDLRGEIWQAFTGVNVYRVERYYQEMLAQVNSYVENENEEQACHSISFTKWKRQIEKDIHRTFTGHPDLNDDGRDSLRRILLAYACHNPSVGYCHAMNFFGALLLLLMPEENAFWTLVRIIDNYFDGYYTEDMIESQVDQLVFEDLMRERFPKLVNHLDYVGVQVAWISGPWFLSIFLNILPWETVFRVWDVLLFEANRVMLFRTALALMELYGPKIVTTKDAGDAISLLQNLTGSTFHSSQLVVAACMGYLYVTEARLVELREKHRPKVLEVIEERKKRGRVWKDKNGIASKLYSFKNDGWIVDEEENNIQKTENEDILGGVNSLPDLQEQVVWLKVELCRLLEEKRSSVVRAEELETTLMEMVKLDNRLELSARIEQLEQEVRELSQTLADKTEQESAMLQLLMKVEQEQKLTEDARIKAEHDVAAQKYAVFILEEKYETTMAELAQMKKRVFIAESRLQATLQYESGHDKMASSPRLGRTQSDNPKKKSILSFGFSWRNKGKQPEESNDDNSSNSTLSPNALLNKSKNEDEPHHDTKTYPQNVISA